MKSLSLFMFLSIFSLAYSQPKSENQPTVKLTQLVKSDPSTETESTLSEATNPEERTHEAKVTKPDAAAKVSKALLTTTAVHSSSAVPTESTPKDILCISNFGRCLAKENIAQCSGKSALVKGLCEEDEMVCCVDNQEVQLSWESEDSNCVQVYGKCLSDTVKCDGVRNLASCGGPTHRQCCSPGEEKMQEWTKGDKSCLQGLGRCQITSLECKGTIQEDTCGGPSARQCCLPSAEMQAEWTKHDEKCHKRWGTCQAKKKECEGGFYEPGLCGGPEERSCCLPTTHTLTGWFPKETACINSFGKCQHDIALCNGTKQENEDMCQGPSYRICCIPSDQITNSWEKDDLLCLKKDGNCQHVNSECAGNYDTQSLCGGPDERQCCVSAEKSNEEKDSALSSGGSPSGSIPTKIIILIAGGVVLMIATIVITIILTKKGAFRSYKRVRDSSWYDRNGADETMNLTSCEDEKGHYA